MYYPIRLSGSATIFALGTISTLEYFLALTNYPTYLFDHLIAIINFKPLLIHKTLVGI